MELLINGYKLMKARADGIIENKESMQFLFAYVLTHNTYVKKKKKIKTKTGVNNDQLSVKIIIHFD